MYDAVKAQNRMPNLLSRLIDKAISFPVILQAPSVATDTTLERSTFLSSSSFTTALHLSISLVVVSNDVKHINSS